jgi:hypothetical protein
VLSNPHDVYSSTTEAMRMRADGRFDSADFTDIALEDEHRCPAGQRAIYRFTYDEHGMRLHRCWSSGRAQPADVPSIR